MSLDVSPDLLAIAERGDVSDDEFVACVRESLPYAWEVVSAVTTSLRASGSDFADHEVPPPSEVERGQLLRALASNAIRGGLERHFGAKLAFQNCHRIAAFSFDAVGASATGDSCRREASCSTSPRNCATADDRTRARRRLPTPAGTTQTR
jgi:hypothetical protein